MGSLDALDESHPEESRSFPRPHDRPGVSNEKERDFYGPDSRPSSVDGIRDRDRKFASDDTRSRYSGRDSQNRADEHENATPDDDYPGSNLEDDVGPNSTRPPFSSYSDRGSFSDRGRGGGRGPGRGGRGFRGRGRGRFGDYGRFGGDFPRNIREGRDSHVAPPLYHDIRNESNQIRPYGEDKPKSNFIAASSFSGLSSGSFASMDRHRHDREISSGFSSSYSQMALKDKTDEQTKNILSLTEQEEKKKEEIMTGEAEPPVPPPISPPPKGKPTGVMLALTRLIELEASMEYAYAKHMLLSNRRKELQRQQEVLETLPVGIEAIRGDLEKLVPTSGFCEETAATTTK